MKHEDAQSRIARQAANRKAHPIWRGIYIYAITCNLTINLTVMFSGREPDPLAYPLLSDFVGLLYLASELFLLLFSPFFIRRFGGIVKFGLALALINIPLCISISGQT